MGKQFVLVKSYQLLRNHADKSLIGDGLFLKL